MRVSVTWGRLIAGSLACVMVGAADAALAQSLFQSIFGGSSPPLQAAPQARAIPPASMSAAYQALRKASQPQSGWEQAERAPASGKGSGEGGYRTVCVRICDGYFWPISANVSKSRFYRDADICRSSCGSETKLFYQSASSPNAKSMIDLQGRPYSRMQTAFVYRKSLVQGCACKGEPWSQAELDRHFQYAVAAGAPQAGAPRSASVAAEVVAGGQSATAAQVSEHKAEAAPEHPEPAGAEAGVAVMASDTDNPQQNRHSSADEPVSAPALRKQSQRTASTKQFTQHAPARRQIAAISKPREPAPKSRQAAAKAPGRIAGAQSTALLGGGSQAKLTWPGDTPSRYR